MFSATWLGGMALCFTAGVLFMDNPLVASGLMLADLLIAIGAAN